MIVFLNLLFNRFYPHLSTLITQTPCNGQSLRRNRHILRYLPDHRKIKGVTVIVDMSVNHIATFSHVAPTYERIMAERYLILTVRYFRIPLYRREVFCQICFLDPGFVMVTENQMLFTVQFAQIAVGRRGAAENQVANDIYGIIRAHTCIPF